MVIKPQTVKELEEMVLELLEGGNGYRIIAMLIQGDMARLFPQPRSAFGPPNYFGAGYNFAEIVDKKRKKVQSRGNESTSEF